MKKLRGKDLTRLGGMLGEFFNNLACAVEADQVDIGVVDWLRSDPGKEAVYFASHRAWFEIAKRYREDQPKTQPKKRIPRQVNPYLWSIVVGTIPATTGQRTFCSAKAMFSGHFDPDFESYGTNVPGESAPEAKFEVFKMIQNGSFRDVCDGFGVDVRKLFWSQEQALAWIENNPGLLHPEGWATFLPFWMKIGEGTLEEKVEFFVAGAGQKDGKLGVFLFHFSDDEVWRVEDDVQFVLPQL